MATTESLQRWRSALLDIEQIGAMPSGQRLRQQFDIPELRHGEPLYQGIATIILRAAATPFTDLWSTDYPADPALHVVVRPVHDIVTSFTPDQELPTQWDRLTIAARTALAALDTEPMGEPTVDEIVADILFALKTTLLISTVGQQGFIRLITEEFARYFQGIITNGVAQGLNGLLQPGGTSVPAPRPRSYFDLATNKFVDHPSATALSLAGFKYFANRDIPLNQNNFGIESLPKSPPAAAKQFAAQAIVNFYTDWEEHYRAALATAHDCDERDFQIDYFGDLNRMRQDYVHRGGISGQSDGCRLLKWFKAGDLMTPTPKHYCELLTAFPSDELRQKPAQRTKGRERPNIRADLKLLREFERLTSGFNGSKGEALDDALQDWITKMQTKD
ncbi:hypothetical protein QDT91_02290 [Mycolicibacterium aubagnense]|uniref:hypothetical protein n=1 Tax=Mycolicibacterium aubagnense TaxID=319707 RepID=UPI00244DA558|nr:hypothetical protein [Mycolicibacterium aubagnense]WGI33239.1 hypothetical protein QDT91_02290 [Mycolicibacterium aubagnense]